MATDVVEDERGRVRHGASVLDFDVRLIADVALVIPVAVHLFDGEGCGCCGGVKVSHEFIQIPLARVFIP